MSLNVSQAAIYHDLRSHELNLRILWQGGQVMVHHISSEAWLQVTDAAS